MAAVGGDMEKVKEEDGPNPNSAMLVSGNDTEELKKQSRFEWFWQDLREPHLLWVKVIFFFQSAGLVTLYPYLTIHMRSLGFSAEDAALVNTAIPVADVFGPPLAGIIADKIGNFRLFMAAVTFLNGASCLLLLLAEKRTSNVWQLQCDRYADGELVCNDGLLMMMPNETERIG